jgi:hypothetical protein
MSAVVPGFEAVPEEIESLEAEVVAAVARQDWRTPGRRRQRQVDEAKGQPPPVGYQIVPAADCPSAVEGAPWQPALLDLLTPTPMVLSTQPQGVWALEDWGKWHPPKE